MHLQQTVYQLRVNLYVILISLQLYIKVKIQKLIENNKILNDSIQYIQMEGKTFFKQQIKQTDPIKRFNHHSVISISLITKIEKDLTKKYSVQDYGIEKYTQLFKDVKESYKVLQLIVEEIESDLKIANLQFVIQPFKKINIFMINIMNIILDGFANIYTLYKQKLIEEQFYKNIQKTKQKKLGETIGVTDENEIDKLRKKHFQNKEKLNYFLNSTGETEQDFNYMQQLKKILENKEIGERYKIPTTSHQIFTVKQKMEEIMQFADLISSENTKVRTQEFINMDLFKLNKTAIQQLTMNIFKNFENAFKHKYIKNIQNTSEIIAKQINNQYKQSLLSKQTQTFQNFGTKKAVQAEMLLREIETKNKTVNQMKENLLNRQKQLKLIEKKLTVHLQQKRQFEYKLSDMNKNYQILQEQYNKYKTTSQNNVKQLKELIQIKNKKISFYKEQVDKVKKIDKLYLQQASQCTSNYSSTQLEVQQTQTDPFDDQNIAVRILKDKQESLNKVNVLKEKKIKRLQNHNCRLKQCSKVILEQLKIQINQEDTEEFIKKLEKLIKVKSNFTLSQKSVNRKKDQVQIKQIITQITKNQEEQLPKIEQKTISIISLEQNESAVKNLENNKENSQVKQEKLNTSEDKKKMRNTIIKKRITIMKSKNDSKNEKKIYESVHFDDDIKFKTQDKASIQNIRNSDDNNLNKDKKQFIIREQKRSKINHASRQLHPLMNGCDKGTQTNEKWKLIRMAEFSCQVNINQKVETIHNILNQKQTILNNNAMPKKKNLEQTIIFQAISTQKRKKLGSKSRQNVNHFTKLQSFQNLPEFTIAESNRAKLFPFNKFDQKRESFNHKLFIQKFEKTNSSSNDQLFRIQKIRTLPEQGATKESKIINSISAALQKIKKKNIEQYAKILKYLREISCNNSQSNQNQLQDFELERIIHSLIAKQQNYSICYELLDKIEKINLKKYR